MRDDSERPTEERKDEKLDEWSAAIGIGIGTPVHMCTSIGVLSIAYSARRLSRR